MPQPKVDFYLLDEASDDAFFLFACRLLEKAYLRKHRIFVFCDSQKQAETLDERLWTFRPDSFIPHNLQGEGPESPPPVQIGYGDEPRGFNDILLSLSAEIPAFYNRFRRVLEIVPFLDEERETSRAHYKQYRAAGCPVDSHKISA